MEIQEQAAYIDNKDRELMLEQLKMPQNLQQQDIPQIPGVAQKDPSVSVQEDSIQNQGAASKSPKKSVSPPKPVADVKNKDLDNLYSDDNQNKDGENAQPSAEKVPKL